MTRPMTEVLAEGTDDLDRILISSGINCTTCQFAELNNNNDMGMCQKHNEFLTCPGLGICGKWRLKQGGRQ